MPWDECSHMDRCPVCQQVKQDQQLDERLIAFLMLALLVMAALFVGAWWGILPPIVIQPR